MSSHTMDYNSQDFKPFPIRSVESQNIFISVCWEWLRIMRILQPHKVWNDLIFAKWYTAHSLTRRLGIALHCKEIFNNDATNKLPDRYRKYWRSHPAFYNVVFNDEKPVLVLPPLPYKFPAFSINHPYPISEFIKGI